MVLFDQVGGVLRRSTMEGLVCSPVGTSKLVQLEELKRGIAEKRVVKWGSRDVGHV